MACTHLTCQKLIRTHCEAGGRDKHLGTQFLRSLYPLKAVICSYTYSTYPQNIKALQITYYCSNDRKFIGEAANPSLPPQEGFENEHSQLSWNSLFTIKYLAASSRIQLNEDFLGSFLTSLLERMMQPSPDIDRGRRGRALGNTLCYIQILYSESDIDHITEKSPPIENPKYRINNIERKQVVEDNFLLRPAVQ